MRHIAQRQRADKTRRQWKDQIEIVGHWSPSVVCKPNVRARVLSRSNDWRSTRAGDLLEDCYGRRSAELPLEGTGLRLAEAIRTDLLECSNARETAAGSYQ